MPSTYSSNLKLELMSTGENSGTWGNITNTNLGTALEQAIVGYGSVDYLADANLTISISNSNSAQAARALVINVTSSLSLTGTRELVVPTIEKQYIVQNNTTGNQSITVKTSAGTGITVPNGRKAHLYVDGTNVIQMFDFVDINGGTIDGATVGANSASTGAFTTLTASGATTLNGAVTLGDAAGDNIAFQGTITSHLLFTDNTYDIGANGATRPRNLFLAGNATVGGNLSVGGTLTLTGGVNLNGNVTVGDSSADTLTINATIASNLLFTDNTYDIGASGATRPRNLFLAGNATIGGNTTMTGSLTVDSTTDSTSATTGSIQTDGGVGIAKALFVGTTVTVNGGTANGVAYLNGSKVLTTGSALTFDGTGLGIGTGTIPGGRKLVIAAGSIRLDSDYQIEWGGSTVGLYGNGSTNSLSFFTNTAEQMRLTSTGLGIGTSSPLVSAAGRGNVTINGSSDSVLAFGSAGANTGYLYATTSGLELASIGSTFVRFSTNGSERMRLDSSGNLGLGVTPSAWGSGKRALQILGKTTVWDNGSDTYLSRNIYNDNVSNKYIESSSAAILALESDGAFRWYTAPSGTAGNAITFTQAMTLDASGNLLVGSTALLTDANYFAVSPGNAWSVFGHGTGVAAGTDYARFLYAGSSIGSIKQSSTNGIAVSSANQLVFEAGGSERARIDSSGAFLINRTSTQTAITSNCKLQVYADAGDWTVALENAVGSTPYGLYTKFSGASPNNTSSLFAQFEDSTTARIILRSNGGIANYQANDVNLSDRREKTNFAPAKSYLETICAIPVQTFNYIDQNMEEDPGLTLGVVAQDVQAVAPELVMESNWGTEEEPKVRLSIYQTDLQYALMKCIQEQQAIIEQLKADVAALKQGA